MDSKVVSTVGRILSDAAFGGVIMRSKSFSQLKARFLALTVLVVFAVPTTYGSDSYDSYTGLLTISSVKLANTTLSNLKVTTKSIISGPQDTNPNSNQDAYDPLTGYLTIPSVVVSSSAPLPPNAGAPSQGPSTFYNMTVTIGGVVSIDNVTGSDTYDGTYLAIPSVQVGTTTYSNVVITLGRVTGIAGGMPTNTQDVYQGANQSLLIPSVQVLGLGTSNGAYTNVTVTVGSICSVNGVSTGNCGGSGGTGGTGSTGGGATSACTYSVTPTNLSFGSSGGTGTVNVSQIETSCVVPNPLWTIVSNSPWIINVRLGSLSNGNGPAYFYVQPYNVPGTRTGSVTVAGVPVYVSQTGTNPLAGIYGGSWAGSCGALWQYASVSGTFTMAITAQGGVSGNYGGSASGVFTGSVDASGNLSTASGVAAGGAYWTGTIIAGGRGSAGSWTTSDGCSGGWSIP